MVPDSVRTPLRAVWNVANEPTETLWWPAKSKEGPKTILLFVPGNPGLVEYYTDFLEEIYRNSGPLLEIYGGMSTICRSTREETFADCAIVSHLGHSVGPHCYLQENPGKLYSLQDQIEHKVNCFDILRRDHNEEDTTFILMGHSIGAYICAEVLKNRQTQPIKRLIALFPTLRDIALTPNGISISVRKDRHFHEFSGIFSTVLQRLITNIPTWVFAGAATGLSYLSSPIKQRLVSLVTGQKEPCVRVTAHQLLDGSVIRNVIYMAKQEMESVRDLDHDFYTTHVNKFIIYYSRNDQWAPLDHYDYMKEKFPNHGNNEEKRECHAYGPGFKQSSAFIADLYLCENDLPHAFILGRLNKNLMVMNIHSRYFLFLRSTTCKLYGAKGLPMASQRKMRQALALLLRLKEH